MSDEKPLDEDELERIGDEGCGCPIAGVDCCARVLVAEIRRLRDLIREAESEGCETAAVRGYCPWCGYYPGDGHAPECAAFTETGDLKV